MGTCRESANIWHTIFKYKQWPSKYLFKSEYFWKDSFSQYYYKWIGCKLFGHKNKKAIAYYEDNEDDAVYCFDCRKVVGDILNRKLIIEKFVQYRPTIQYKFFEVEQDLSLTPMTEMKIELGFEKVKKEIK